MADRGNMASSGRNRPLRIALTTGEPAGIGPELALMLATRPRPVRLVLLGDADLLAERLHTLADASAGKHPIRLVGYAPTGTVDPRTTEVLHVPLVRPVEPGRPDPANARHVLSLLDRALSGCLSGEFDAMVTAPLHKAIINEAGIRFSGHTEYLAEKTATARVVMMLVGGGLRVALATTHLPLAAVPAAITGELLTETITILHADLVHRFGLTAPRILVAGLNPHAGEGGHMGREEIEVIVPALDQLRQRGLRLVGPLPADTLFVPRTLAQGDCVLAMYHDQGLPVLKHASFGHGVNVTLGLPVIRTSVDHGTAFDLAGTGRADPGSLAAAVELACTLAHTTRLA